MFYIELTSLKLFEKKRRANYKLETYKPLLFFIQMSSKNVEVNTIYTVVKKKRIIIFAGP